MEEYNNSLDIYIQTKHNHQQYLVKINSTIDNISLKKKTIDNVM